MYVSLTPIRIQTNVITYKDLIRLLMTNQYIEKLNQRNLKLTRPQLLLYVQDQCFVEGRRIK